jgi:diguanylate cyclase
MGENNMSLLSQILSRKKDNSVLRETIRQLQESEEKYRLIVKYAPIGFLHFDAKGIITTCNDNFVQIIGSSYDALIGLDLLKLPDEKIVRAVKGALGGYLSDYQGEYSSITADKVTPIRVLFAPLVDDHKLVTGGIGLIEDITESKKKEEALRESEIKYRDILETIEDGYYEVNLSGKIIACNRAAARMLGYSVSELIGSDYDQICMDSDAVFKVFNEAFKTAQPQFSVTIAMRRKDDKVVYAELSLSLTKDQSGTIIGFRGLGRDITERIALEKKLKYLSFHDQLTGICNRLYFENELERLTGGGDYPVSVIVIDVDDLKVTNDSRGHDTGDELLKACASVVKLSLRSSDVLARIGGDEFAVLLPYTGIETGQTIVDRITKNIEAFNDKNSSLKLSISIGLATADGNSSSLQEALKEADNLMYMNKFQKERLSG